jgi:small subunit ribosomal protein S21
MFVMRPSDVSRAILRTVRPRQLWAALTTTPHGALTEGTPADRLRRLVRRAGVRRARACPSDQPRERRNFDSRKEARRLAEVRVGENETFESALRRFNKKIQQSGILAEARRREHYEKPSVKRKRKEAKKRKSTSRA